MLESTTGGEPNHPCDEVVASFTQWFPCRFEENFPLISSSLFLACTCFPDTTNITVFPPFPSLPSSDSSLTIPVSVLLRCLYVSCLI